MRLNDLSTIVMSTHAEKVNQTEAQIEAIEKEIRETQALTSIVKDLNGLKQKYESDSSSAYFEKGIDYLSTQYESMRTIRGDGNCYYRAFLYNLGESLLANKDELARILTYVKESKDIVVNVGGYEEMAIEIFYDTIVEFIEGLSTMTKDSLHEEMNQENSTSDYCTWYLRVLTATFLKADPARFIPYLEGGYVDIFAFCQAEIEPMGKECTMVSALALAECFCVSVKIEYLDGHEFKDSLTSHDFGPETSATKLHLLYRPGHYDILYRK